MSTLAAARSGAALSFGPTRPTFTIELEDKLGRRYVWSGPASSLADAELKARVDAGWDLDQAPDSFDVLCVGIEHDDEP